jgi:hypothetical protein
LLAGLALALPGSALAVGSISGTVLETAGGTGVNQYEVELWQNGTVQRSECTANDGSGAWSATNVPAGTYQVYFSGDGTTCPIHSTYAPEWYGTPNNFSRRSLADSVVISDGGSITNVNASLEDGAEMHGTVTDPLLPLPSGVQNVTVDLIDVDGFTVGTACTAADGTYTMDPIAPGGVFNARFSPAGTCPNAGAYSIQWYDHAPTQNAAAAVVVSLNGQVLNNIDATMLAPVTLTVGTAGAGSGTVTANRGGISCPGTCQASLAPATVVDLTAQPAAGSVFSGWSGGGCSGTQTCQLTMTASQAVTATFQPASSQPPGGDPTDPTDPSDPGDPPSSDDAPKTKIDQAKVKAKSGKATFAFSGSGGTGRLTFECSLVKAKAESAFSGCTSPMTYKPLKKGEYRFEGRARDASGAVDGSPASTMFKSKARKRK